LDNRSKQLGQAGFERATLLRSVFDGLQFPVLVADDDGHCVMANHAAREQFGEGAGIDELEDYSVLEMLDTRTNGALETLWDAMRDTGRAVGSIQLTNGTTPRRYRCELQSDIAPSTHLIHFELRDTPDAVVQADRDSRQRAIGELGRFALTESTIPELCDHSVEVVGPHLAMELCAYYPAVDEQEHLEPTSVWRATDGGPRAVRVSGDEAYAFRHATSEVGEPIVVEDIDVLDAGPVKKVLARAGARSAIFVSVGCQMERLGLMVGASSRRVEIGESRREFLQSVSRVLGQAISSKLNLERLEESRSRLQVAMRLGRLSRFDWDVDSGIIKFDQQMARNLGLEPGQLQDTVDASFQWVYDKDRDEVIDKIRPVIDGEEDEYEVYARIRGLNEEWRWQLSRGRAVERDDTGRAARIIGFQQDVHERVKSEISRAELEDQLRQSRKMEALGRLAGGIAHDFNNLLTAISGYAELVYDQLDTSSEARLDVREILVATERAERLTNRLLSLSRRKSLRSSVIDVNEIVREFDKMLDRILGEEIRFRTNLDAPIWRVEIDRSAVEQILLNLVVNARDAMPKGGRLIVETENVELSPGRAERFPELSAGDYVRLKVSDTGVGMDALTLERALEPFFTTKGVGEGTGLGLATVYGVVRQAGGSLAIESALGEGTTVELYLPRSHQELSQVEVDSPGAPDTDIQGETILVAEDDEVLLNLVVRVLRETGFRVEAFTNPKDALAWLEKRCDHVDLILTDVVMPEMRGTELAENALERHPRANVLFMSGYTADAEFSAWTRSKNVGLLRKPFTPSYLVGRVQDMLARRLT
jgi:signal transduction histidine kinase